MGKKHHSMESWDTKTMFHCSIIMFFLCGVATLTFYRNNSNQEFGATSSNVKITLTTTDAITNPNIDTDTNSNAQVFDHQIRLKIAPLSLTDTCDLFSGKWVHDNQSHYPLYNEDECPYLHGWRGFDPRLVQKGQRPYRPHLRYPALDWSSGRFRGESMGWPSGQLMARGRCPFDGKAIVERLRGIRLLFVGDSVNRNQWNSMMCMLHSSIPGKKRVSMGALNGTLYSFRASDYNISIDYYWAPMLVESNGDDPSNHRHDHRTIRLKSIEKHAKHWVDADILVFNTYLWWRLPLIKLLKSNGSLLGRPNQMYYEVDNIRAYKMVLQTWSRWVRTHIDHSKTKMFFMGLTATHSRATDWGGNKNEGCYGEIEPVMDDQFWESGTDQKMLRILESLLNKLQSKGVNVKLINITQLTQCRKDAHPSVHRKLWRPLTEDQKRNPQRASDCTHWCLPGVPDIWNELLLAYIFPA
ncbi:hypothetical protein OSB04_024756 [Centaurea solstitialis]|uniref:Trichome birefringence-like N-terminal domain-containing protein n=1 Tax=Centaurea solstitialis TaxID=347529 RepID=A0AA38SND4_9ASTR|nr:hypothetical protein OSB04_024756 [Centaurea solstitialis]